MIAMKRIITVTLLLTVFVTPAFSADGDFYAGIDLGRSNTDAGPSGAVMTNPTVTNFGGLAGYQFDQYFGVEAFYTRAGEFSSQNVAGTSSGTWKSNTFGAVVVAKKSISNSFSLYGKFGIASTKTIGASITPYGSFDIGATRNSTTYGIGAQYNINSSTDLRFGLDRFAEARQAVRWGPGIGNVNNGVSDYNTSVYSLAAVFRF
jgi:OOP family OmpA-OmpF porin